MRKILLLLILLGSSVFAQVTDFTSTEIQIGNYVKGTLLLPNSNSETPLAILIQGSGPTDRDGNQPSMRNDALKKLAEELASNGIASFRYDKRGANDSEIRFDDFVADARSVLDSFSQSPDFTNLILIGHSQGSLVAILAAENAADAIVSIAGAGQSADSLLINQIGKQLPTLKENLRESLQEVLETGSSTKFHPLIAHIFPPSLHAFLQSYMKYDPTKELADLEIPVLIINGTNDLQVSADEAQLLFQACRNGELLLLENMNHVLREITDQQGNLQSYNEPERPLHPDLVPGILNFIKKLE